MKLFIKESKRRVMKKILNFKVQQVYTGQLKIGQEAMPAAGPMPPRRQWHNTPRSITVRPSHRPDSVRTLIRQLTKKMWSTMMIKTPSRRNFINLPSSYTITGVLKVEHQKKKWNTIKFLHLFIQLFKG